MKTVIITGVKGQDGSFLAEMHLEEGDLVIGIDTWNPRLDTKNIKHIIDHPKFVFVTGDITEKDFMYRIFEQYEPDYFYNMAAISFVAESFHIPQKVFEVNTIAVLNILEIIRTHSPSTKFLQASSSEQFGTEVDKINLDSPMNPVSPYGVSKLASFHLTRIYKDAYNLFCVNSLCFNHESERRGDDFVTQKIARAVVNISNHKQQKVTLGNLESCRDWGYAKDYCKAMMLMMEQTTPKDYILATGESYSVKDFVEEAFKVIGLKIRWKGEDMNVIGVDQNNKVRVTISPKHFRPLELYCLKGDNKQTRKQLKWKPKTKFKELVKIMVEHQIEKGE